MSISEIIFFSSFIVFIVGILLLDMLVIDRKAHDVSLKEAGIWTGVWIALSLLFAGFLWFHGDLVHGIENFDDLKIVTEKYASHLNLDENNFEASLQLYREQMTISYITGYLIEKMLSVDNLFVMMMIFTSFAVSKKEYQHVLNWGILGAIVLRCLFIFIGTAVIKRFDWVLFLFGAFLLYSSIKMFFGKDEDENIDVANHPVVKFTSKHFRVFPHFNGDNFFVRAKNIDGNVQITSKKEGGKIFLTPLFVTVIMIEFSDLIFAFDSIPAVFAVSLDPYVVFFSNIFAILGLRAMFFLLAGIVDKFRFLKIGVGFLLLFISVKLLIHKWVEINNIASLIFIISVLVISILLSVIIPKKEDK
ncbi:MAG: TerC/Alx family metal homeostasis membrane protein [Bacteroidales bacterium]|nr:TerC/Alx family metal homeostasis membrane protein [Bacteroidales bacterium]